MGRREEDAEAPREHREHRSHKSHKSHRREHKHDRYDKTDRPEKDLRDRDVNKNSGQQGSGEASPGRQRDEAAPAQAFDKPQGNDVGGENSMSIEETNRCIFTLHCCLHNCGLHLTLYSLAALPGSFWLHIQACHTRLQKMTMSHMLSYHLLGLAFVSCMMTRQTTVVNSFAFHLPPYLEKHLSRCL